MKGNSRELHRNPGNTRNEIILDRGNCSVDGTRQAACVWGGILGGRGGNCKQESGGDEGERKSQAGTEPGGDAGWRAAPGLEKQGWDWVNIAAHAKTWKTFLSVYPGERRPLAENVLLAIPGDTGAICCFPNLYSRQPRSSDDAAAKASSRQFKVQPPKAGRRIV